MAIPTHRAPLTAALLVLIQWPIAAVVLQGDGLATSDAAALAAVVVGAVAWLVALRRGWSAALILAIVLLLGGVFLAMRRAPLPAFLAVATVAAVITTAALLTQKAMGWAKLAMLLVVGCSGWLLAEIVLPLVPAEPNSAIVGGMLQGQVETPDRQAFAQLLPSSSARAVKRLRDGGVAFDVRYHIDAKGSRRVPGRPESGPDWWLFGCSFTFGEGLEDDQTIAAHLQRLRPDVRLFNFGIRNAGPSDALIHLRRKLESGERPQRCVYLFMSDHLRRAALPYWTVAIQPERPRFVIRDSQVVHLGKAGDTIRDFRDQLRVNMAGRSEIYRRVMGQWTPDDSAIELVAALTVAMRDAATEHGGAFTVASLPTESGNPGKHIPRLKERWRAQGLDVVECDLGETDESYFLADGHPSALGARYFAEAIHAHFMATGDPASGVIQR